MKNHKGLKTWILIGFCFAAQLSMASDYNPPMKEITGSEIPDQTAIDFVENGENVKVGQNFTSTRSGQTVKIYVEWAEYVGYYKNLLKEATSLNYAFYGQFNNDVVSWMKSWVTISGSTASSLNSCMNTGVHVYTGKIKPLPSYTTWMALPAGTNYSGNILPDGTVHIWRKRNCSNIILNHIEYVAPVVASDFVEVPAPVVVTRRALGSNEKITCLGDTVVMGIRTASGTYTSDKKYWLSDSAATWYKINGSQPKTLLCGTVAVSAVVNNYTTNNYYNTTTTTTSTTTECDCDGEHHTYINGVCCCGVRKMSQNYSGSGRRFVQQRSSWRSGGGYVTFNSGGGQQRQQPRRVRQQQRTRFGGRSSNGGSNGGVISNGGSSGGGGSNGGSGLVSNHNQNANGGNGRVGNTTQRMPRRW